MDILRTRFHAQAIVEDAVAAYWDVNRADFHKANMVATLTKLAEAMGYMVVEAPLQEYIEDATLDA